MTIDWQVEDIPLWGHKIWKQIIVAASRTIWVTQVDVCDKGVFSNETG